jgi:hypothetical protein
LPKGLSEKVLVREAKTVSDSLESLMIIQLVLQVTLKGSINDIWSLFLILQLIAYLSLYDTSVPSNVEIYVTEFRNMVTFQILKPDKLL